MKGCSRAQSVLVNVLTISTVGAIAGMHLWPLVFKGGQIERANRDLYYLPRLFEEYKEATGKLPTDEEGFEALIKRPAGTSGEWTKALETIPRDPWGNRYHYRRSVRNGIEVPEVVSAGRDGMLGTEDDLSSLEPEN